MRHGGTTTNAQALVYDPENRLTVIAQAGVFADEFGYAADGARLWKRIDQNPTNIQVWIGNIYEEKGGKHLFHVFAGGQQVCTFEAGSSLDGGSDTNKVGYYYTEDSLNSSSALSDSLANQTEVNVYYPFGRTQTASPQASFQVSRRFTGQVYDKESGLYWYNSRYYDPELGRFVQPDTTIPDLSNPQSYNRYSYCVNDPLTLNDPNGHVPGAFDEGYIALRVTLQRGGSPQQAIAQMNSINQASSRAFIASSVTAAVATGVASAAPEGLPLAGRLAWSGLAGGAGSYTGNGVGNELSGQPFNQNAVKATALGAGAGVAAQGISEATTALTAPASATSLKYHYTTAPESSFKTGLRAQSSVTDNPNLTAQQAVEQLGVKTPPNKVIPIQDKGNFVPNKPAVVERHPLGKGGGADFTNPQRVPPEQIRPAIPIKPES